jgi:uncharacterized protein
VVGARTQLGPLCYNKRKKHQKEDILAPSIESRLLSIPISKNDRTSGILSLPTEGCKPTAIILAHGAANDMMNPLLTTFAEGLARVHYPVLRFNFLYAEQNRRSPDREPVLVAAWEAAYEFLKNCGLEVDRIVAAGKSLGGRIASQMVAKGQLPVEGLIFLGYPLHRMGDATTLHDSHLYSITVPMLFIEGTRDTLCDLGALAGVLARLKAPHDLLTIEGGDHSFNVPKSAGLNPDGIYTRIVAEAAKWLSASTFR